MRETATAFAVIGDRFHNSDYIRTGLQKTLVKDLGLSIDFTDDVTLLDADTLDGYKILILFRDGLVWPYGYGEQAFRGRGTVDLVSDPPVPEQEAVREYWMTDEQGEAVKAFVSGGGSALLYHNVTYIATENEAFRNVLGAETQGHPPVRTFKVEVANSDHPIAQGVNDFVVTDEQHFMTYYGESKHVFLRSINEEGLTFKDLGATCEAGWAYDYGDGRVCYLAPGHLIPVLWNPEYEKLQQNAVRWLLQKI